MCLIWSSINKMVELSLTLILDSILSSLNLYSVCNSRRCTNKHSTVVRHPGEKTLEAFRIRGELF